MVFTAHPLEREALALPQVLRQRRRRHRQRHRHHHEPPHGQASIMRQCVERSSCGPQHGQRTGTNPCKLLQDYTAGSTAVRSDATRTNLRHAFD